MPPTRLLAAATCLAGLSALPLASWAQVTVKPDGEWRALFTAGASVSSGNSDSTTINLSGEAVKATTSDKLSVNAKALYVKNDDADSENRYSAGGNYQRDLTPKVFGFGQLDLLRDEPANLSSRYSVGGGAGYHVIRRDDVTFDVSAGLGYTRDRYMTPETVNDVLRSSYSNTELLIAEESNHKFTDTTTFRQKLTLLPNLKDSGQYRATFDTGLSVAMSKRLSLTATVSYRYNSDPGDSLKKSDTLLVTGVSYRID